MAKKGLLTGTLILILVFGFVENAFAQSSETGIIRDSDGIITSYNGHRVTAFPKDVKNPYAYDTDVIYRTDFDVIQWLGKNFLATTGSNGERQAMSIISSYANNPWFDAIMNAALIPTRIFIRNVPNIKQIGNYVAEALVVYVDTQGFELANGSYEEVPVFDIVYVKPD